jgi:UDP-glucose 4-epimerase
MTVLVTGGAGFLGSHLTEDLVASGQTVRVLDNFTTGMRENLSRVRGRIELIEGDITSYEVVRRACAGVDSVYHCAAVLDRPGMDPMAVHRCCATGTLHVLQAAKKAECRRVVYASTAAVYGWARSLPLGEDHPTQPASNYGSSKLAGEVYCLHFTQNFGLSTVRLRLSDVIGPQQPTDSPYGKGLRQIVAAMVSGQRPVIFGDGNQLQEFLAVEDAVQAFQLAAQIDRGSGRVYNISRGKATTARELVAMINGFLGTSLEPIFVDSYHGQLLYQVADVSRAKAELGFCPATDLSFAVGRMIDEYRSKAGQAAATLATNGSRK